MKLGDLVRKWLKKGRIRIDPEYNVHVIIYSRGNKQKELTGERAHGFLVLASYMMKNVPRCFKPARWDAAAIALELLEDRAIKGTTSIAQKEEMRLKLQAIPQEENDEE